MYLRGAVPNRGMQPFMQGFIVYFGVIMKSLKALDRLALLEENACRKEPHLLVIGEKESSFSG